jgi:hypothetical protein
VSQALIVEDDDMIPSTMAGRPVRAGLRYLARRIELTTPT